jgi:hypothetical protein
MAKRSRLFGANKDQLIPIGVGEETETRPGNTKQATPSYVDLFPSGSSFDRMSPKARREALKMPEAEPGAFRTLNPEELAIVEQSLANAKAEVDRIGHEVQILQIEGEPPIEGLDLGDTEQGETLVAMDTEEGPRFEIVHEQEDLRENTQEKIAQLEAIYNQTVSVFLQITDADPKKLQAYIDRTKPAHLHTLTVKQLDHPEVYLLNDFKNAADNSDFIDLSPSMMRLFDLETTLHFDAKDARDFENSASEFGLSEQGKTHLARLNAREHFAQQDLDLEVHAMRDLMRENPDAARADITRTKERILKGADDFEKRVAELNIAEEYLPAYVTEGRSDYEAKLQRLDILLNQLTREKSERIVNKAPRTPERRTFIALQPNELYTMGYDAINDKHTELSKTFSTLQSQIDADPDSAKALALKIQRDQTLDQLTQLTVAKKIIGRKEDFLEAVEDAHAGDESVNVSIEAGEFIQYLDEKMADLKSDDPTRLELENMRISAEGYRKQHQALESLHIEEDLSDLPEVDMRDTELYSKLVRTFRERPVEIIAATKLHADKFDDVQDSPLKAFYEDYKNFADLQAEMNARAAGEEPNDTFIDMSIEELDEADYETIEDEADEVHEKFSSVDADGEFMGPSGYEYTAPNGKKILFSVGDRVLGKGPANTGELVQITSITETNPPRAILKSESGQVFEAGFEELQAPDSVEVRGSLIQRGLEKMRQRFERKLAPPPKIEDIVINEEAPETQRDFTVKELRVAKELGISPEGLREYETIFQNLTGPNASKEARRAAKDHELDFTWDDFMNNDPTIGKAIFRTVFLTIPSRKVMVQRMMDAYYQAAERGSSLSVSAREISEEQNRDTKSVYQTAGGAPITRFESTIKTTRETPVAADVEADTEDEVKVA